MSIWGLLVDPIPIFCSHLICVPGSFGDVPGPSHDVPGSSCDVPGSSHDVPESTRDVSWSSHDVPGSSHDIPRSSSNVSAPSHTVFGPSSILSGLLWNSSRSLLCTAVAQLNLKFVVTFIRKNLRQKKKINYTIVGWVCKEHHSISVSCYGCWTATLNLNILVMNRDCAETHPLPALNFSE